VRIAYEGSWFDDEQQALLFQNPFQPLVPGSTAGLLSLDPNNDLQQASLSGEVTLPFWSERYKPTSFLDVIDKNVRNDEHSLLLLDIDQPAGRMMTLGDAVELLRKAEKDKEYGIIDDSLKLLVLGDVGKPSELIKYVSIGEAAEVESLFAGKILTIIIPATPSFAEEEALSKFA
jgi:diphthine synthase